VYVQYNAVHGFWPVESTKLADEPTGRGEGPTICMELQCDKVTCTDRGGEKG
jgi:hypothetical protein